MAYHAGLVLGISVGLLAGFSFIAFLFKKKVLDMHFDERQERARGKAFQYAFFTLLGCMYIYALSEEMLGRWCDLLTGTTICMAIAVLVFAVTCILKDAYLSLREKPRQIMTIFTLLSAINLGIGGVYHFTGGLVEDGILTFRAINLICGAMTLVILVVYIVNYLLRDREDAE